ncbi:unnamed protein product [Microthlaspi erraticum]|uniref:Jacalin-type lectin domain-containing protein n=1 Tax=Microthlaspi erraticum TaxID=1685480 RepID=A0A6D2KBV7_9BRAS|nr:unnamed protein product [Microthlaspi erraticum]
MFKVGPIGSTFSSDKSWDEKGHTTISGIYVTFNDYGIKSLQFSYVQNGAHVMSKTYGSSEALSGVHYNQTRITYLTFHTNKRKHGPFCKGEYVESWKREIDVRICDRNELGGLFGSFYDFYGGSYLQSIGMYVLLPKLSPIHTTTITRNQTLDYRSLKIVDGFPVKPIRPYKPKLKDRILSELNKAIQFLKDL